MYSKLNQTQMTLIFLCVKNMFYPCKKNPGEVYKRSYSDFYFIFHINLFSCGVTLTFVHFKYYQDSID